MLQDRWGATFRLEFNRESRTLIKWMILIRKKTFQASDKRTQRWDFRKTRLIFFLNFIWMLKIVCPQWTVHNLTKFFYSKNSKEKMENTNVHCNFCIWWNRCWPVSALQDVSIHIPVQFSVRGTWIAISNNAWYFKDIVHSVRSKHHDYNDGN